MQRKFIIMTNKVFIIDVRYIYNKFIVMINKVFIINFKYICNKFIVMVINEVFIINLQ